MMEVALLLLGKMFGRKSRPKTITETVTTYTSTVPEMRAWKERTLADMTARAALKPTRQTIPVGTTPLKPTDGIVTGTGGRSTIGITGGPPVTTTRTTFKRTL